jgi:hypothetical protein
LYVQVLGSLKQKIDQYLAHQQCIEELVAQAQDFLVGREEKLANARRHALEAVNLPANLNNSSINNGSNVSNNSSRRSSLTSDTFSRGTASCPTLYLHFTLHCLHPRNFVNGVQIVVVCVLPFTATATL